MSELDSEKFDLYEAPKEVKTGNVNLNTMKNLNKDEIIIDRFSKALKDNKLTMDQLYNFQYIGIITMQEYTQIVNNGE